MTPGKTAHISLDEAMSGIPGPRASDLCSFSSTVP